MKIKIETPSTDTPEEMVMPESSEDGSVDAPEQFDVPLQEFEIGGQSVETVEMQEEPMTQERKEFRASLAEKQKKANRKQVAFKITHGLVSAVGAGAIMDLPRYVKHTMNVGFRGEKIANVTENILDARDEERNRRKEYADHKTELARMEATGETNTPEYSTLKNQTEVERKQSRNYIHEELDRLEAEGKQESEEYQQMNAQFEETYPPRIQQLTQNLNKRMRSLEGGDRHSGFTDEELDKLTLEERKQKLREHSPLRNRQAEILKAYRNKERTMRDGYKEEMKDLTQNYMHKKVDAMQVAREATSGTIVAATGGGAAALRLGAMSAFDALRFGVRKFKGSRGAFNEDERSRVEVAQKEAEEQNLSPEETEAMITNVKGQETFHTLSEMKKAANTATIGGVTETFSKLMRLDKTKTKKERRKDQIQAMGTVWRYVTTAASETLSGGRGATESFNQVLEMFRGKMDLSEIGQNILQRPARLARLAESGTELAMDTGASVTQKGLRLGQEVMEGKKTVGEAINFKGNMAELAERAKGTGQRALVWFKQGITPGYTEASPLSEREKSESHPDTEKEYYERTTAPVEHVPTELEEIEARRQSLIRKRAGAFTGGPELSSAEERELNELIQEKNRLLKLNAEAEKHKWSRSPDVEIGKWDALSPMEKVAQIEARIDEIADRRKELSQKGAMALMGSGPELTSLEKQEQIDLIEEEGGLRRSMKTGENPGILAEDTGEPPTTTEKPSVEKIEALEDAIEEKVGVLNAKLQKVLDKINKLSKELASRWSEEKQDALATLHKQKNELLQSIKELKEDADEPVPEAPKYEPLTSKPDVAVPKSDDTPHWTTESDPIERVGKMTYELGSKGVVDLLERKRMEGTIPGLTELIKKQEQSIMEIEKSTKFSDKNKPILIKSLRKNITEYMKKLNALGGTYKREK